jgi:hypothetical protein
MRRLTIRVAEPLYRSLQGRAAAKGQSLNEVIAGILGDALSASDQHRVIRARLRALGRLAHVDRPRQVISREAAVALTRGLGTAVSDALSAERRRSASR